MATRRVTAEVEARLRALVAQGLSWADIGAALGFSAQHATRLARLAGVVKAPAPKGPKRDPAFEAALTRMLTAPGPRPSWGQISRALGRSTTNCQKKAQALGLYAPPVRTDPAPDGGGSDGGAVVPPPPAAVDQIPGRDAGDGCGAIGVAPGLSSLLELPGVSAPGDFSGVMTEWPGPDAPLRAWFRPVSATLEPMGSLSTTRCVQGAVQARLNRQAKAGVRA